MIISATDARKIGGEDLWCDMVEAIANDDAVNVAEEYAAEVVAIFKLAPDMFFPNAINRLTNMVRSGDYPELAKNYYAASFSA